MKQSSLRGIFPDKPVPHKRNFIRENVMRIRTMHQPELRMGGNSAPLTVPRVPGSASMSQLENRPARLLGQKQSRRPGNQMELRTRQMSEVANNNISHRSIQTNTQDFETGDTTYTDTKRPSQQDHGHGDITVMYPEPVLTDNADQLDFIRQNINAVKSWRPAKSNNVLSRNQLPINYKKGVPPKYIRARRESEEPPSVNSSEALVGSADPPKSIPCPPGHVILPDDKRKETLRVLRERYAEKIQELNMLPVRSDTLKMQQRKIDIEGDLQKIDEGIKIFQRNCVFVKMDP